MLRRILIGVLLALAVVTVAVEVRSYRRWNYVGFYYYGPRGICLMTSSGSITIGTFIDWHHDAPYIEFYDDPNVVSTNVVSTDGFRWLGFIFEPDTHETDVGVPLWVIEALLIFAAGFVYRRKKIAPGLCRNCGYDLRAMPEGGGKLLEICPECGRD